MEYMEDSQTHGDEIECADPVMAVQLPPMAKHWYVAVTCKTPACLNVCALKYLGPDIGQLEVAELAPTGAVYQCGKCQKTHRYELAEMYTHISPHAPPPGWQNGWEP